LRGPDGPKQSPAVGRTVLGAQEIASLRSQ
jgi:hypothetical protein